jgi:hypothetical protein
MYERNTMAQYQVPSLASQNAVQQPDGSRAFRQGQPQPTPMRPMTLLQARRERKKKEEKRFIGGKRIQVES